jgi:hypothetical protein
MIASREEATEIRATRRNERVIRMLDEECRRAITGVLVPGSLPVVRHPDGVVWRATRWDGDTLHGVLEVPGRVVAMVEVKP